jgi:hypothetical protein
LITRLLLLISPNHCETEKDLTPTLEAHSSDQ